MHRRSTLLPGLSGLALAFACASGFAAELLVGEIQMDGGSAAHFSLSGESREQVVGGEIHIGERAFRVTGVSRLGLIGARRRLEGESVVAEYAVFSSSFSDQTAVGQPWVAADSYRNCDQRYNSFVAIYRVEDAERVRELGNTPYPTLADDRSISDQSEVYCFLSRPP